MVELNKKNPSDHKSAKRYDEVAEEKAQYEQLQTRGPRTKPMHSFGLGQVFKCVVCSR